VPQDGSFLDNDRVDVRLDLGKLDQASGTVAIRSNIALNRSK
jgi:hypothetical protein